jgi:hypothetical protein
MREMDMVGRVAGRQERLRVEEQGGEAQGEHRGRWRNRGESIARGEAAQKWGFLFCFGLKAVKLR